MGDTFGILSPVKTEFDANPFDRIQFPQVPVQRPTFGSIASIQDVLQAAKPAPRVDSLQPRVSLRRARSQDRPLRTKFSSPTLREQVHLRQIQTNLEAAASASHGGAGGPRRAHVTARGRVHGQPLPPAPSAQQPN